MRLLEEMLLQWHALVFFRFTVDIDKDLFTTMTFHIKSRLLVRIGGNSSSIFMAYLLFFMTETVNKNIIILMLKIIQKKGTKRCYKAV